MKKLAIVLTLICSVSAFADTKQPVRNHALATHHKVTGFKHLGHSLVSFPKQTVLGAYEALEASVDAFGVSLQMFADAVDMGVAAPLESLPKPLNEIGVGVHYVYEGFDAAGQFLAK